MGGISVWQLLIIAVIVVLLFGTKKLRGIGGDLGGAVKGFNKFPRRYSQILCYCCNVLIVYLRVPGTDIVIFME